MTDTSPNAATAGNQQFFSNVLGGGTEVVVLGTGNNGLVGSEANESAISGLVGAGGSLYLLGESSIINFGPASNAILNTLLGDLGIGPSRARFSCW